MAEEPSTGELARRLADLQRALPRLMSQELFVAEQRAVERRFTTVERDLEDLEDRLGGEIKSLLARIDARERVGVSRTRRAARAAGARGLLRAGVRGGGVAVRCASACRTA